MKLEVNYETMSIEETREMPHTAIREEYDRE